MARTNENTRYKGVFATGVALAAAIPVSNPGDFAFVTGTGTIWSWTTSWGDTTGIGAPNGADTQIQFNDGGDFGANASLTFTKGTATLLATHITGTDVTVTDVVATTVTSPDTPTISTGVLPPASTPTKVGDIFVDTNLAKVYISTGTSASTDWTILN